MNISKCKLVWEGTPRPDLEDRIRSEIENLQIGGLEHPEDLIFHELWLDEVPYGPCVLLSGRKGDDRIYVEFHRSAKFH